jgi:hypothetical protein
MDRSGLTETIGKDNFFPRVIAAVVSHLGDDAGQEQVLFELAHAALERFLVAIDTVLPNAAIEEQERLRRLRRRVVEAIESIDEP